MTATTSGTSGAVLPPPLPRPAAFGPLAWDVARSEWTKLRTVRSTYWTLLCTAVGMVGFGGLLDAAYTAHYHGTGPANRAAFDPAAYSMSGFFLAQLAICVLGVVVMTSEYQTGSIRATLAAVPQRTLVLGVKSAVFGAVATVVGAASALGSFLVGQAIFSGKGLQARLGDPGAVRTVVGVGLYLAVLGLLALGLGTLIRRTAGAIAAIVALVIILPVFVTGLPTGWQNAITRYLPSVAGQALIGHTKFTPPGTHLLSPWAGFTVLCGYTLIVLIAAATILHRRDV